MPKFHVLFGGVSCSFLNRGPDDDVRPTAVTVWNPPRPDLFELFRLLTQIASNRMS